MKKLIAAILASLMVLSLAACGGGGGDGKGSSGDMNIAMVTDSGDITDQSFNQTTYETAKAWSEANGVTFNYYTTGYFAISSSGSLNLNWESFML